jgi:hypothetical protein
MVRSSSLVPSPPSHYHCDLFTSTSQAVRAFITRRGQRAGRESPGTPRLLLPLRDPRRRPPTSLPVPLLQSRRGTTNPALFLGPRSSSCARLLAGEDPADVASHSFPGGRPVQQHSLVRVLHPAADPAGFAFFNSRDTRFSNFLSVFAQTRRFLSPFLVFIFGI